MSKAFDTFGGTVIQGSRCPKCNNRCAYNGNYWCTVCEWILGEKDERNFIVLYILLMKQQGKTPKPEILQRYSGKSEV